MSTSVGEVLSAALPTRRGAQARASLRRRSGAPDGGPPRWVSGLLAGVQAALLSFLVVVTPALAAYVATSADPSNADIGWPQAVAVGAVLWLLGHGGAVQVDGTLVTVVPLGITALAVFACWASAQRSAHRTWSAWAGGVVGYLLSVVTVLLAVGSAGPGGAGPGAVVRTLLGAGAVAAVGLGAGTRRLHRLVRLTAVRVPPVVRVGVAAGVGVAGLLVAAGSLVTVWWAFSGRAATGDVILALGVDTFGAVLLGFAQLALAPNLMLWATAWVAGPGFSVGEGTLYSPAEVLTAPLPALPLLGALPTSGAAGGAFTWAPLALVATGAVAGWWVHRRLRVDRAWQSAAACAVASLVGAVAIALAVGAAGGAAGPGRLAAVGAPALLVGGVVALSTLVASLAVAVPLDRLVRAAVVSGARRGVDRVRDGRWHDAADADQGSRPEPVGAGVSDRPGT